jgi:hypothetical protein
MMTAKEFRAALASTTHSIEALPATDICRYRGRCSCGLVTDFSTYSNSTRAHLRAAAKARRETPQGQAEIAALAAKLGVR